MTGAEDHAIIATLLLAVLCFVAVIIIFCVFVILHLRRRQRLAFDGELEEPREKPLVIPQFSLRRSSIRRQSCWLAIRNRNVRAVQEALALHNSKPCTWAEGLAHHTDHRLFISPPISGWILVIGSALPDPAEDVDACFKFLMSLSLKLGQVQLFSANTVLNHHAWAAVETGHVLRAYAWAGRTIWNQGKTTLAEHGLRMKCFDYAEFVNAASFNPHDGNAANVEKVHLLAARWSVDPEEIDERSLEDEHGIVGEPSRFF